MRQRVNFPSQAFVLGLGNVKSGWAVIVVNNQSRAFRFFLGHKGELNQIILVRNLLAIRLNGKSGGLAVTAMSLANTTSYPIRFTGIYPDLKLVQKEFGFRFCLIK